MTAALDVLLPPRRETLIEEGLISSQQSPTTQAQEVRVFPLELLGISSHLLPRPPINCLVLVSDNPSVYNPRVSAQTTHKLSGVSVEYPHPLYIYLPLPRPPVNCLVPVSDYSLCHFVVWCFH